VGTKVRGAVRAGRWAVALAVAATALGAGGSAGPAGATSAAAVTAEPVADVLAAYQIPALTGGDWVPRLWTPLGYSGPQPVVAPQPTPAPGPAPAADPTPAPDVPAAPVPAPAPAPDPAPTAAPAAPAGVPLPLAVSVGSSTQVVTVVAASSRATTARLTAWELGPGGWTAFLGPVTARIGSAGVGAASETTSRTPAGTFSLTEAFGRQPDPGTGLPYRVIDQEDWWVSDVASPLYNQHTRCAAGSCPFDESAGENLWSEGSVYDHAVVIDYNRDGAPGAGSAFFLHVTNGAPTAGCVAIDGTSLTTLMRWLDPGARPLIAIGIG
jgi:L,D-peptidoglycan transpeptidase YkuD (ErfK/YbiS/YcfS/YnhG family)